MSRIGPVSRVALSSMSTRERVLCGALVVMLGGGLLWLYLGASEPKRLCGAFARAFVKGDETAALAMLPPGAPEQNFLSDEMMAGYFQAIKGYLPTGGRLYLRDFRHWSRRWCECEFEVMEATYPVPPASATHRARFKVWTRRIGGRWQIAYPGSPFTDYMRSLYGVWGMKDWMASVRQAAPAHTEADEGVLRRGR
jgi:hypothetical protein